jgi:hypothetical protein
MHKLNHNKSYKNLIKFVLKGHQPMAEYLSPKIGNYQFNLVSSRLVIYLKDINLPKPDKYQTI